MTKSGDDMSTRFHEAGISGDTALAASYPVEVAMRSQVVDGSHEDTDRTDQGQTDTGASTLL